MSSARRAAVGTAATTPRTEDVVPVRMRAGLITDRVLVDVSRRVECRVEWNVGAAEPELRYAGLIGERSEWTTSRQPPPTPPRPASVPKNRRAGGRCFVVRMLTIGL